MSSQQEPQQGRFNPAREAWNFMEFVFFLFYRQMVVFMRWGYGARAFSLGEIFLTQVMIGLVVTAWGGVGLSIYAALYSLLSLIHLGYRLSLTEENLPHTYYTGESWLLYRVFPNVEFSKKKYPVWFPEDSEIAIKLLEPLLFAGIGYVIFDAGDTKLGLYLIIVGIGAMGANVFIRMEKLKDYYDKMDLLNQMRYEQRTSEEKKQHHKGFKYAKPLKAETAKSYALTEDELKAKIQDIEARTRKPQAQAPPVKEQEEAIGKDKTSSSTAPTPAPVAEEEEDSSDTSGISIFETIGNEAQAPAPTSSTLKPNASPNGTAIKTATLTKTPLKPPRSKIYKG